MQKLTHLSLFTGVGGLDIAAEGAGFRTVGQCEWADYPRSVLQKHWPDVPRWRDITTLTKEDFYDKTGLQTITALSGGFPCQPFSAAGNKRGFEDDRYLWPEMLRIARILRPTWVIGENVAGIIHMALDTVLADLEGAGYTAGAFVLPAVAVNAPHRRDRVAIIGRRKDETEGAAKPSGLLVANAINNWTLWGLQHAQKAERHARCGYYNAAGVFGLAPTQWWGNEPGVGRVAYGLPFGVDRLKCLGNAVVPYQFYPVFSAIARIEKMLAG